MLIFLGRPCCYHCPRRRRQQLMSSLTLPPSSFYPCRRHPPIAAVDPPPSPSKITSNLAINITYPSSLSTIAVGPMLMRSRSSMSLPFVAWDDARKIGARRRNRLPDVASMRDEDGRGRTQQRNVLGGCEITRVKTGRRSTPSPRAACCR